MNKPTHISEEMLKRFLAGELSKTEQANFDDFLAENPFEKEAIEGMQMLTNEELEQDLEELRSKMRGQTTTKLTSYRAIAASVVVLLCSIALALYFVKSPDITQAVNTKNHLDTENQVQKEEIAEVKKEETSPTETNNIENQQAMQKDKILPKEKGTANTEKPEKAFMEQEYLDADKAMGHSVPTDEKEEDAKLSETEVKIGKKEETKDDLDLRKQDKATEGLRKEAGTNQAQQMPAYNEKKESKQRAKKSGEDTRPQENRALNIAKEDSYQANPLLLQGQVIDSQSQIALANVKVSVKGQKQSSFSDSLGKFSLEIPFAERYVLVLELPGYKILEIEAKPHEQNIFYLRKK
mgnify:CR=1 FL=1